LLWWKVGDDYDQPGMERLPTEQRPEIDCVVGNQGESFVANALHQLMILDASETQVNDVVCFKAVFVRDRDQARVQTFIDEESEVRQPVSP